MKILTTIALMVIAMVLTIILGALAYVLLAIYYDRRWEKIKSDKYKQHNLDEERGGEK